MTIFLACKCSKIECTWLDENTCKYLYKKNVEIMAPLSGVQMLGRDSNGPHSDMHAFILNSLNSLPLDIDAS